MWALYLLLPPAPTVLYGLNLYKTSIRDPKWSSVNVAFLRTSKMAVSTWGYFAYQDIWPCPEMCLSVTVCCGWGRYDWHLGDKYWETSKKHRTAPTTKNNLVLHIPSAEVEKPTPLVGENVKGWFLRNWGLWLGMREHVSLSHTRQDKDIKHKGKYSEFKIRICNEVSSL